MFRRLLATRPCSRRLLMMALRSPNPNHRRRAINVLGSLQDPALYPQAVRMLEFVAQNDPVPELRNLASSYLEQMRSRMGTQSGNAPSALPPMEWNCAFCGSTHLTSTACPNCAAPRP